ncbi:isochorismate synthase [Kineococcus arenarius]|uniref:isochorismate synthase n=1 Tax=unclassified Kineococcus TaxID=2621656 RepID=UPI003D7D80BF
MPERLLRAEGAPNPVAAPAPAADGALVTPTPPEEGYAAAVTTALLRLRAEDDELGKVVLGRLLDVQVPRPVDVRAVLTRLLAADPGAFVYAVDLPGAGPAPRTLVGASPELLVARSGRRVTACPLAGSAPRCADPAEDRRRARALLASAKDLAEHAVVADAVRAALAPLCVDLDVPAEPGLRSSATMWHLATPVTGVLADPATTSLDLLAAMHPTPAVCGVPPAAARRAIADLEPFDRGYFTGAVGWCDADGDGEWAVTIRCAEVQGGSVRLFAGAGVVAASDPAAEVAETAAKFRTSLAALGVGW